MTNVFTIKVILRLFELVSELGVSFHQSSFGEIGLDKGVVERYSSMLNSFPFSYLGLLIRVNPHRTMM